jgi:hypothetical protein
MTVYVLREAFGIMLSKNVNVCPHSGHFLSHSFFLLHLNLAYGNCCVDRGTVCPIGYYCSRYDTHEAIACPVGRTSALGASSEEECLCLPGTHASFVKLTCQGKSALNSFP